MKNVTNLLILPIFVSLIFVHFACKQAEPVKQSLSSTELKMGDTTTCPVMGTKFKIKKDTKYALIDGKKYYVCCPACIDKIKNAPKKYLSGSSHGKEMEMEHMQKKTEETE